MSSFPPFIFVVSFLFCEKTRVGKKQLSPFFLQVKTLFVQEQLRIVPQSHEKS